MTNTAVSMLSVSNFYHIHFSLMLWSQLVWLRPAGAAAAASETHNQVQRERETTQYSGPPMLLELLRWEGHFLVDLDHLQGAAHTTAME